MFFWCITGGKPPSCKGYKIGIGVIGACQIFRVFVRFGVAVMLLLLELGFFYKGFWGSYFWMAFLGTLFQDPVSTGANPA